MNQFLNIFFFVFHTSWIIFNIFGWIWKRTRRWNLLTLLLTALSWFGLGVFYGFGYCPCTHWHWVIRRNLGYTQMPNSYIKFLIYELTGFDLNATVVDFGTAVAFLAVLIISLYLNLRDFKKKPLVY